MYQALYRKWRPKTFDDVVGQKHVTQTLKSEIKSGRISHAYLFTGSRGTGKTSCAKILAKAINCTSPADGNPCLECDICSAINSDKLLDIVEIDAASNNGVENIRAMRDEVVFTPTQCKYRVYIVDEVHMLSAGAFNAFLKVLEEPPPHVVFILATTEIHKIPATIISRCQRFDFYRIPDEDIFNRINYICKKENILITEGAARIISAAADGGMRDALSVLDQCANACGNNINEEFVKSMLGISDKNSAIEIIQNVFQGNCAQCLKTINEVHRKSGNMLRLCEEISCIFRDIMIAKASGLQLEQKYENIGAGAVDIKNILYVLDVLQASCVHISAGANSKLEAEIAVAKICGKLNPKDDIQANKSSEPKKEIIHTPCEISAKEKQKSVEKNTPSLSPEPAKTAPNPNSAEEEKFDKWQDILKAISENKSLKSLYISLKNSAAYTKGNYILIDAGNSLAFELLRKTEYRTALKEAIQIIAKKRYNLGPYEGTEKKQEKEETETDMLEDLINSAKTKGINVTSNQEDN